jgi:hypothetical protein
MSVECSFCGGYFPDPMVLLQHKRDYHENKEKAIAASIPTEPGKMMVTDLKRKDIEKTKKYLCKYCDQEFDKIWQLGTHIQWAHKRKNNQGEHAPKLCPYCGEKTHGRHAEFCKSRPGSIPTHPIQKVCSWCQKTKSTDDFYKSRTHSDGFKSWCKECVKKKLRDQKKKGDEIRVSQTITPTITIEQKIAQKYLKKRTATRSSSARRARPSGCVNTRNF